MKGIPVLMSYLSCNVDNMARSFSSIKADVVKMKQFL